MTTILVPFLISFFISLLMTPLARNLGKRIGAIDMPASRNVHMLPIPRSGGLAIFIAFFAALFLSYLMPTGVLIWDRSLIYGLGGAVLIFGVGFLDDIRRLGPGVKFLVQIISASLAFAGGLQIHTFISEGLILQSLLLSYLLTVFWFILLINAVNLIDGLDGLAAGVTFFASAAMVIFSIIRQDYSTAILFAVLGGCMLGFLRYNFNPASIFMGDGGSYFIGYMIAFLSIRGAVKSQLGAVILIPLVALGVPIFDTLLSPVRRFLQGRDMFRPDKGHIHHLLIRLGLSAQHVVLFIYGISLMLCISVILIVNYRNETIGLLLMIFGAGIFILIKKLGYFEYVAFDKIYGWMKDITYTTGISRERRSFLGLQIEISESKNINELWQKIGFALEQMRFDSAEMYLKNGNPANRWTWSRYDLQQNDESIAIDNFLRIELPLANSNNLIIGKLLLSKNLKQEAISPYSMRRVDQLRKSINSVLGKMQIRESELVI